MLSLVADAVQRLRKKGGGRTRLSNIRVQNIAAVAPPSNMRRWLIIKNADGNLAVRAAPAMTYGDAMLGHKIQRVYAGLAQHWGALMETLDSIRASRDADKGAAITTALNDFLDSLQASMPAILAELENADAAPMEKGALTRLRPIRDVVGGVIADADTESEDPMKKGKGLSTAEYETLGQVFANFLIANLRKAQTQTAVDVLEERVAGLIHARPELTRQLAVHEVFKADPDLYERVRKETTHDKHGRTLAEGYGRVQVFGVEKSGDAGSAEAEVQQKIAAKMQKSDTLTYEQALDQVYRENRGLYERVRREPCA